MFQDPTCLNSSKLVTNTFLSYLRLSMFATLRQPKSVKSTLWSSCCFPHHNISRSLHRSVHARAQLPSRPKRAQSYWLHAWWGWWQLGHKHSIRTCLWWECRGRRSDQTGYTCLRESAPKDVAWVSSGRSSRKLRRSRSCVWLAFGRNRQNISSFLCLLNLQLFLISNLLQQPQQHIFLLCSTVRMANSNIAYSILWIIVLWFISWPIAGFAAGFWILIQVCLTCNIAPCRPKVPLSSYVTHNLAPWFL